MYSPRHGGLHGKARRSRERSRAARLHSRQLISEYLDPAERIEHGDRPIRMGRRNEFLSSIASTVSEPAPVVSPRREAASGPAHSQLELPLTREDGREAADLADARDPDNKAPTRPALRPTANPDIRFEPVPSSAPASTGAAKLGRFLYGCLLGSAAAALLLMVIHLAIG